MNNTQHISFDWSLARHERISRNKEFQLRRQLCVQPLTVSESKTPIIVDYFLERVNLFEKFVSRVFLKSSQFQLISQQMDVDYLVFELLSKRFEVQVLNISREPSFFAQEDEGRDRIMFQASESTIPYVIQMIFYDKILDRYSIHHYQLSHVQEYHQG